MADQQEAPPKKVGSLRDRIAAFEKAGAGSAVPAPAPAPRPKPAGFGSWKPRPPSPTSTSPTPAEASQSTSSKPSAGLSASDAKESIGKGGSLKERMAALQGKGAFGGPPPVAPKPQLEKPKWKPPPVVAAPPDEDDELDQPREERKLADIIKSPPPPVSSDSSEGKGTGEDAEKPPTTAEGAEPAEEDPEEEERQRRAAIAARMARLGGTRVGMAPPVFGKRPPPPPKKRSSVIEDAPHTEPSESSTSPKLPETGGESGLALDSSTVSSLPAGAITEAGSPPLPPGPSRRLSETASLRSVESADSHASPKPPSSMPVPSAPRRAAPPRKKPVKPTALPPPIPEPEVEPEAPAVPIDTAVQEQNLNPEPSPEKAEIVEAGPIVNAPGSAAEKDIPPLENDEIPVEASPAASNASPNEVIPAPASTEFVKDQSTDISTNETPQSLDEKSDVSVDEVEAKVEIDEETRRHQVSEKIAKMGGINPFAAPPRRQSKNLDEPTSPPVSSNVPIPAEISHPTETQPEEESNILSAHTASASQENAKARSPSPPAEPRSFQEKEANVGNGGVEDDDESDYSDEDEEIIGSTKHTDLNSNTRGEQLNTVTEDQDDSNSPSIPVPPPVRYSGAPPYRSAPVAPDTENLDETDSEKDDEEMARSLILVPPSQATKKAEAQSAGGDSDDSAPLPVPPREFRSESTAEPQRYIPPNDQVDDSEGSLSEYEEDEEEKEALPVRPPAREEVPLFVPPPPPATRPTVSHPPPVTRALPAAPKLHGSTSQSSLQVPTSTEIFDDDEGDPIDPFFHSPSRRGSTILLPSANDSPNEFSTIPSKEPEHEAPEKEEDQEALRRRTIAKRMAKLGGIRFGAAPPVPGYSTRQAPPAPREEEEGQKAAEQGEDGDEEQEERARKARIAAKMAGMGGMRIGMMPTSFPPRKSHVPTEESAATLATAPPPPARPPPQAHDIESDQEDSSTSDDGVKVEAEDSEIEEVNHDDVEEEAPPPPPVPTRGPRHTRRESAEIASSPPHPSSPPSRPPVPAGLPMRRPSTQTTGSQRRTSGDSGFSPPPAQRKPSLPKPQSEYVMVEEPQGFESQEAPPPPPQRPAKRMSLLPPTRSPPPPEPQDSISSQWELPVIPTAALEFGNDDLAMSWTEAGAPEDFVTPAASSKLPQQVASPPQTSKSASTIQLSSDDLIALWGRVGVQVCESATNLFERSKKGLIGDGTFPGFIQAVIEEVPNATLTDDWGYLVYKQSGASVQKRSSDIMPGDLVELNDAKFKGHKGLQAYHQNVGAGEPVVGVISEFEPKKSKIRVFQANQHVGQQTVEAVSYRLEDLKSGSVKVYRVLEG